MSLLEHLSYMQVQKIFTVNCKIKKKYFLSLHNTPPTAMHLVHLPSRCMCAHTAWMHKSLGTKVSTVAPNIFGIIIAALLPYKNVLSSHAPSIKRIIMRIADHSRTVGAQH
jgi:hypothetical protein